MSKSAKIKAEFRGSTRHENGKFIPTAVACICPMCNEKGIFQLAKVQIAKELEKTHSTFGKCPSCEAKSEFFLCFKENSETGRNEAFEVTIFPAPESFFEPIQLPRDFPENLRNAVSDAEQSFRAGLYSPALTCGGRALEGIFLNLSKNRKEKLYNQIETLCSGEGATEPLKALAHAIRQGRNVGAHFDEKIEPNERSALLVIELLHYIISYFYLLPEKAKELEIMTSNQSGSSA